MVCVSNRLDIMKGISGTCVLSLNLDLKNKQTSLIQVIKLHLCVCLCVCVLYRFLVYIIYLTDFKEIHRYLSIFCRYPLFQATAFFTGNKGLQQLLQIVILQLCFHPFCREARHPCFLPSHSVKPKCSCRAVALTTILACFSSGFL